MGSILLRNHTNDRVILYIMYPEKSVNNIRQSETKYNKNSTLCCALLKTNAITVYTLIDTSFIMSIYSCTWETLYNEPCTRI